MADRYQEALSLATRKHEGQYRTGGLTYVTHPIAVAEMLREKGYGLDYQIAGLFHDLLEDTDTTEEEILWIGGEAVLHAVKLVTKTKGYIMADYIAAIQCDPMARAVKAADRLHNLRCAKVCSETFRRRYIRESLEWYLELDPEIAEAVKELEQSLGI